MRRDIERLRGLGYPVLATAGTAGYRLGAGADLPPLLLDDDEAVAVAMGLRTAAGGSITGIEETSVRALAKLEQVLPSRLRHRINALQSVTVPMANTGPTVDPSTLTAIAAACRDSLRLRFDYRTHDGTSSIRTTEPPRCTRAGRWYLIGWDVDRRTGGTYRVDRLNPRTPTGPRFTPRTPPDPDIRLHLAGDFHIGLPLPGSVHPARQRRDLQERIAPTTGALEPIDEHSCTLRAGSNSLDELAICVTTSGSTSRCTNPPSSNSTSGRWQPGSPARRIRTAVGPGQVVIPRSLSPLTHALM